MSTADSSEDSLPCLAGWETYPRNFAALYPDLDVEACARKLASNQERLFTNTACDIRIVTALREINSDGQNALDDHVTDESLLDNALARHLQVQGDHYICLTQSHTWAPFKLSDAAFRKISTAFKVPPYFLHVAQTFGHPDTSCDEDCTRESGLWFHELSAPTEELASHPLEACYSFKYMAKTGRESWPWSERRIGVYHRDDQSTQSSIWITLRPNATAPKVSFTTTGEASPTLMAKHLALFHKTTPGWTGYLRHLENELRKLSREFRMDTSTDGGATNDGATIKFSRIQNLRYQCELLQDARNAIESSVQLLDGLNRLKSRANESTSCHDAPEPRGVSYDDGLQSCISHLNTLSNRAENILEQANQLSGLTSVLLSYRHTQAITTTTGRMESMAHSSQQDERLLLELTRATKRDSAAMKITTVIAMGYLPGTFAATLFSTGFADMFRTTSDVAINAASLAQVYAFLGITGALIVLTVAVSWLWSRRVRLREETAFTAVQATT